MAKGDKDMFAVHFYENNNYVLNQALEKLPVVDENVRIKGRNGKVVSVQALEGNKYFVFVEFEKVVERKNLAARDDRRKRR